MSDYGSIAQQATAYVALGSNLGDREKTLRLAIERLDCRPTIRVDAVSGFFQNPAVGGPPNSPEFINAVARVVTTLAPQPLLDQLLAIERSLGRERREKWGPRTIDLDLLLYGSLRLDTPHLTLPHPRLHERRFVLQPLAELDRALKIPGMEQTVQALLDRLA